MRVQHACNTTCMQHTLHHRVTIIEARELLGTFDGSLREYAARQLVAQGVVAADEPDKLAALVVEVERSSPLG